MEDFVKRLYDERNDLDVRYSKLINFCKSDNIKKISQYQREMLAVQQAAMWLYLKTLNDRLDDLIK